MAARYVYTGGSNTSPYDTWAKAATTMTTALSGSAAGDIFYVASDHLEAPAVSTTLTSPGFPSNPCYVYSVNRAGSVPPVAADMLAGGHVRCTTTVILAGSWYIYGMTFTSGFGATGTASLTVGNNALSVTSLQNCKLRISTSGTSSRLVLGNTGTRHIWENVQVEFNSTSQSILVAGFVSWRNTTGTLIAPPYPTTLFTTPTNAAVVHIENVDFSILTGSNTLFGAFSNNGEAVLKNCKLGASVVISATPSGPGANYVELINCDSGSTNTRHERYRYEGTETTETTIIRSGGASDGTTPISRKIVTTANSKWLSPFEAMPLAIWNETTGSAITLTMEGVWGSGSVPNNDEVWWDVSYMGSTDSPIGSWSSGTKANNIGTVTALASSSAAWGGSTTKFKQSHVITPQKKGWIYAYPKVAAASATVYLDPMITVT